ncbi:coiled-coil domain-containing protein [Sphaerisporangium dianthi]|uniref:Coiled-coil domain-containing protein n=1 Tax=Sphaerisporangium dianthi TaxID=1436120 RepID=A0ABV9CK46_9ACTN
MRSGRAVALAAVLLGLLTLVIPSAEAKPSPQAQLDKLTKQAAELQKAYRGEIQSLEETRRAAQKAGQRVKGLRDDLTDAERRMGQFFANSYMSGSVDGPQVFTYSGDPDSILGQVATITYLAEEKNQRLNRISRLIKDSKNAKKEADGKIAALKKEIARLEDKKDDVERLLKKFGFQAPDAGSGLTARMVSIRNVIMQSYPMPFGVGCLRAGDPGEHGKGRACDFMMSSGGRLPDAASQARGDALAEWCIENGRQLGIMYIIWRQRYYDIRTGAGWRTMSDRGGVTANHYDHVHVSVF